MRSRGLSVDLQQHISHSQPCLFRFTVGKHPDDRGRSVEVLHSSEAKIGNLLRGSKNLESHDLEKVIPRNFLDPAHVVLEKIIEIGVTDGFGCLANSSGIRKEFPL